jgi:hypothetical protein
LIDVRIQPVTIIVQRMNAMQSAIKTEDTDFVVPPTQQPNR